MVSRLKRGDTAAFDELFGRYQNEAVKTAYLITGRRSNCEDIVQETFIKCFRHINDLKNPDGFRAWFFRILTRTAWKYGKAAGREVPTENMAEIAEEKSAGLSLQEHFKFESNRILYSEINRLEPKLKTSIVLYYFNGLSTKEIAKVSGCFEGTVKSRLYTARKHLKSRLGSLNNFEKECGINAKYKAV